MPPPIVVPQIAYRDMAKIRTYIEQDNPLAAKKMITKIFAAIKSLEDGLYLGAKLSKKFDIESELSYYIVLPYIILFSIETNTIVIRRILDTRSDYLTILGLEITDKVYN